MMIKGQMRMKVVFFGEGRGERDIRDVIFEKEAQEEDRLTVSV